MRDSVAQTRGIGYLVARHVYGMRRWPAKLSREARSWHHFWTTYQQYVRLAPPAEKPKLRYLDPCIYDNTLSTPIEPIYFYQDAWAFERIVAARPSRHVDVGSHHKYVALLSKVVPVTMVDVRPLALPMDSIRFLPGSILKMPFEDRSVGSLSSLCVIEHIGLGRYGDALDRQGTEKALAELMRVLAPGGDLYLSLPLDVENRVYFNAHRAFEERYFEQLVAPYEILARCYIRGTQFETTSGSGFRVGCFHIRRPVA